MKTLVVHAGPIRFAIAFLFTACAASRGAPDSRSAYSPTVEMGAELLVEGKDQATSMELPSAFRAQIPELHGSVKRCYDKTIELFPGVVGQLNLHFSLDASGKVQSVGIATSSVNNLELEQCVERAFIRMKDVSLMGVNNLNTITYPVFFRFEWGKTR